MAIKDYSLLSREDLVSLLLKYDEKKKYGIVWDEERVPEKVVTDCQTHLPVLTELKEKEIITNPNELTHLLIEGDNYHTLSVLNYTHQGKIDLIYIDPPYNTGNKDFIYNDKYVDSVDKFRDSKWLNFMNKRLELAKNLLTEEGVIFISIDDNEQAPLKMLCDKIFGKENFISNTVRITTKRVKGDSIDINKIHDYILMYSKSKEFKINHRPKEDFGIYQYEDEHMETRGRYLIRPLDNGTINYSKKSDYIILAPDGSEIIAGGDKTLREKRLNGGQKNKDWCFRWNEEKLKWGIENDYIVFKQIKGKYRVYFKIYQFVDNNLNLTVKYDNYVSLIENCYNNQGTSELKDIIGESVFSYPKPLSLMKEILFMASKKDSIILDFFAGTGTTGHSVLDFNNEDKESKRQFILCTNNENKIAEDVTYPRIQKVINGYKNNKNIDVNGLGGNLKYFKTSFVENATNRDQVKANITRRCTEMLCIKEGIYNLYKESINWKIFKTNNNYLAVYYDFEKMNLTKLKNEMNKIDGNKVLYCFTYHDTLKKTEFSDWNNIRLEAIPNKILEVYKELFNKKDEN